MYIDQNLQKALSDRIYDKRKPAALQLEQIVRKAAEQDNRELVEGIITELSRDFAYALRHPNYRNGGLIGLAAVAIALGQDGLPAYLDDIIQPILACFGDADARVRYYACESLYNVAKIAKGEILTYFNEIFDALCKLTADVEESVRNGANLVDQLLRDIVVETATSYFYEISREPPHVPSAIEQPEGPEGPTLQKKPSQEVRLGSFSLERFIPLLVERIYVMNPSTRMFLVQWIMLLDSIPDLELIKFLPEFLEGLLLFLSDTHKDVRVFTKNCLENLLKEIRGIASIQKQSASERQSQHSRQSESQDEDENGDRDQDRDRDEDRDSKALVTQHQPKQVPTEASDKGVSGVNAGLYRMGQDTYIAYSQIVDILLSKMDPSHDETQLVVLDWIEGMLEVSPSDVLAKLNRLVSVLLPTLSDEQSELRKAGRRLSDRLLSMLADHADVIDKAATVHALSRQLDNDDKVTRLAALQWLAALYSASPNRKVDTAASSDSSRALTRREVLNKQSGSAAFSYDELLVRLIAPLSDPSDEVVAQNLDLLALILRDADKSEFEGFTNRLVDTFRGNQQLFGHRGRFVCLQLCIQLSPERVFRAFAEISGRESSQKDGFESLLIQNLNNILLTAPELSAFRHKLTQLHTEEGIDLFTTLFLSWKQNSVATLALCLLAQAYDHAYDVLEILAEVDVTVSTLIRIDKLVQLIEGPIFAPLRMHLLRPQEYHYLYKTLYGLLMVLPQSKAFTTLHTRLSSVSGFTQLQAPPSHTKVRAAEDTKRTVNRVDWDMLLAKFKETYELSETSS